MADKIESDNKKKHNKRLSGRKALKKKSKKVRFSEEVSKPQNCNNDANCQQSDITVSESSILSSIRRNPKAFTFRSSVNAAKSIRRSQDLKERKTHIPLIDRTPLEPPPIVVAVVGPPSVGKSTLVRCIIRNYTRKTVTDIKGPVTVVSGKRRRITLIECNNDLTSMIDIAKVADLVLLLIDASFGFEMETFEFLNICQVHGFPRVMGVLTHLDKFKNNAKMRQVKKSLKHRFWTDVYPGAKLFYLSALIHGQYRKMDVHNLCRFISVMKFRPITWRQAHPYMLVDRMEDVTSASTLYDDIKCDRNIVLYGYLRGVVMRENTYIHIPGAGDFSILSIDFLPDPCPLSEKKSVKYRRSLDEKDKALYAPMSAVGGVLYDKDAVYIDLGGSHSHLSDNVEHFGDELSDSRAAKKPRLVEEISIIKSLGGAVGNERLDNQLNSSQLTLFSNQQPVVSSDFICSTFVGEDRDLSADFDKNTDNVLQQCEDGVTLDESIGMIGHESVPHTPKVSGDGQLVESQLTGGVTHPVARDNQLLSRVTASFNAVTDSILARSTDAPLCLRSCQFVQEARTLHKQVYTSEYFATNLNEHRTDDMKSADMEVGGIFLVKESSDTVSGIDKQDCSRSKMYGLSKNWLSSEECGTIADCFVTGNWKDSDNASVLLKLDALDDDCDGDFEDLESGEVHKANSSVVEQKEDEIDNMPVRKERENLTRKQLLEKKKRLKAQFDAEYDDNDKSDFYNDLKRDVNEQTQLNLSEFEGMDDRCRVRYEGYRPGMYVRLEIGSVPCEFVEHFDATYPLIVGGLTAGEENIGYIQARFKRHRWYVKTLKNRDPLIMSVGWRRFQTTPLYSMQDHNGRHRSVKYTPDHLHVTAHFWGPITPQNSGVLAVQTVADDKNGMFRIAATGCVLDLDKSANVVKKLKLVGTPKKVMKKTAFIQGMFTSALEAAKFEGALCRTVSGVRGHIKRALLSSPGHVRATFEDVVKMSDIVFVRTWVPVQVPRLYAPLTTLYMPSAARNLWQGMKTVGQLKRERDIHVEPSSDCLYLPTQRSEKIFAPLRIPKSLQKQLPYSEKLKLGIENPPIRKKEPLHQQRVAVVLQPHQQKVEKMLSSLRLIHERNEEMRQRKNKERVTKMLEKYQSNIENFDRRQKRVHKHLYRVLSKHKRKR